MFRKSRTSVKPMGKDGADGLFKKGKSQIFKTTAEKEAIRNKLKRATTILIKAQK